MEICRTISAYRTFHKGIHTAGDTIGLVATRGGLHAGHLALVAAAKRDCTRAVVTLFAIPPQHGGPRDLDMSVRPEAPDLAKLEAAGVDAVLIPNASDLYPDTDETIVETTRLSKILQGQQRPGHFRAITTLAARLFNITRADAAYFGSKDYQQLQVIRRMVRDLQMPITIHGVATVREDDGLAMSSRNLLLSPEDRAAATCLSKALLAAANAAEFRLPIDRIDQILRSTINREPRARLRAVDIIDPDTLAPAAGLLTAPVAVMISAEFSGNLLIDQCEIRP